jgi:hypothetical protein
LLLSRCAICIESVLSFLVLNPWIARMYSACPSTNSNPASMHASASQYQLNVHSQHTVRLCRYGSTSSMKYSKLFPRTLRCTRMLPSLSIRHTYICLECRSTPQLYLVVQR